VSATAVQDAEAAPPPRPRSLLDVVERRGSMRAVGLLRALLGLIVIRHLWPDLVAEVTAVERFHVPWWSWLPVPSPGAYRALVVVGVVAGAAMAIGLASRVATTTALVTVTYLVFVDMTAFAHNRGFLVWLLFGVALLPSDRAVSLDAWRARRRGRALAGDGPLWPLLMLRVVVSTVYLTSGGTKALDADWRSGLVLWDRTVRHQHLIPFDGWVHDLLTSRAFHHLLSPGAIAIELFLAAALWLPRTRVAAIWVALVFHGSIELVASVQTFSWSAIAALLIWVTPRTRDRALIGSAGPFATWVRRLDWLERFRIEHSPAMPTTQTTQATQATQTVLDRDGRVRTGGEARWLVLSRLPLTFPVGAPGLALHRLRTRSADRRPEVRS
jgi:uncharacterized membrane protein YphA (DoxX/SURF4 family)